MQAERLDSRITGILSIHRLCCYIEKERLLQILQKTYLQECKMYQQFLKTKRVSDKLVKSALFFARLDIYLRAGIFDFDTWDQYDDADVQDLKRLFALLRQQSFTYQKHCYLNPTFGLGSNMVGGADADVIIDHTLLEIKVTRNLELERSQFSQLIGYYFLSQIGGVNNKARLKPIKRIGIYFARYGYLWTIPISDLGSSTKRKEFKTWFTRLLLHAKQGETCSSLLRLFVLDLLSLLSFLAHAADYVLPVMAIGTTQPTGMTVW